MEDDDVEHLLPHEDFLFAVENQLLEVAEFMKSSQMTGASGDYDCETVAVFAEVLLEQCILLCEDDDATMGTSMQRAVLMVEAALMHHTAEQSGDDDESMSSVAVLQSFKDRQAEVLGVFSYKCAVCFDTHAKGLVTKLTCEHTYCDPCVANMCMAALSDEQLLPIRCCNQEMPSKVLRRALNADQMRKLEAALAEHKCNNRLYCPNPVCSEFIGERGVHDKAERSCDSCTASYCASCGEDWHDGVCLAEMADEEELRNVAASEGWQQCSQCRRIVEKSDGCDHMTCTCGFEFCYTCGGDFGHINACSPGLWRFWDDE
jgi:hypothetical protein